jgi:hypothetical protein
MRGTVDSAITASPQCARVTDWPAQGGEKWIMEIPGFRMMHLGWVARETHSGRKRRMLSQKSEFSEKSLGIVGSRTDDKGSRL